MTEVKDYPPTGGYDGEEKKPEMSSGDKLWVLRRIPTGLHEGIFTHLLCDGEPRAVVHLKDEDEFNWLKPRIDGLQPSRDVESTR